nr:MAG TPA: hypothetical protein [Caudoviricetes sp.]
MKKPRRQGQGSPGVTFQPKWRGDARTARREGVHGDAGIRKLYQNTKQMILTDIKAVRLRAPGQVYLLFNF